VTTAYLDYEVALLLAKYGKVAVLSSLSKQLKLSQNELEDSLHAIPEPKPSRGAAAKAHALDPTDEIAKEYPKKAEYLRRLRDRFESRAFLPELRDVRRFFDQHRSDFGSNKSRAESLPQLLRLLAELSISELDSLCGAQAQDSYSSLGLIADEILRKHG
jgi:hypothetical protein